MLAGTNAEGLERAFRLAPVRSETLAQPSAFARLLNFVLDLHFPLRSWNTPSGLEPHGEGCRLQGAVVLYCAGWWSGDWLWEGRGSCIM